MAIKFYSTRTTHGYLSNFSRHTIQLDNKRWPTVEHYFQAMKFPNDPERQERIRRADNPKLAKKIAWEKDARIRSDWDNIRSDIMLKALRAKFTQHPELQRDLLDTGSEELIEHTRNDSYWGDGGDGVGQNKLGQLLMQIRNELKQQIHQNQLKQP